ncbi:MAG: hypothetical protein ACE5H3_05390 [Planctomycetota bacterium]
MTSILKLLLRLGVILTLVGVGAMLFAGPERVQAVVQQVKTNLQKCIDDNIDDPVALRTQLRELEKEYPKRIAQVRGDLAELNQQIRQTEREKAISERVVALAEMDLGHVETTLKKASLARESGAFFRNGTCKIEGHFIDPHQFEIRSDQIQNTIQAYSNRAAQAERELGYLAKQRQRLEDLQVKLEKERAQFQSQLWQLDRQVDAVARNDRLIELLNKRQKTIDEMSRFEVGSLDDLTARLSQIRNRQEAELEMLTESEGRISYEERAEREIRHEGARGSSQGGTILGFPLPKKTPGSLEQAPETF